MYASATLSHRPVIADDDLAEFAAAGLGSEGCECVGIDGKTGSTTGIVNGKEVTYPADTGSSCQAWDAQTHPSCTVDKPPAWCSSAWCYVDPCKCNLATPKSSDLFPTASFHGRTLFYSYATCGSKDSYSSSAKVSAAKKTIAAMCDIPPIATNIGSANCLCAGIANRSGTTMMNYGGKVVAYPGAVGTYCSAWDANNAPKCKTDSPPSWCSQAWCYVDGSSCEISVPPKVTKAMKGASIGGEDLRYSYATCGGSDSFTSTTS